MATHLSSSTNNTGELHSLRDLRTLLDAPHQATLPAGAVTISAVDMWDNQMPGAGSTGGANISLTLSATNVRPVRLHVVRVGAVGTQAAPPDWDDHYEWVSAPPGSSARAAEDAALADGTTFIVRPPGFYTDEAGLRLQAWKGPDWEGQTRYVAVVELEGGIRVQSEEHELQVVY